jgi:hypothetical protein
VLSQHRGVIPLSPAVVSEDLLRISTGTVSGADVPLVLGTAPGRSVTITGGPERFSADVDGVPMTIEVDPHEGWVQARGQWWWCGRFQIAEHPVGTLLEQSTINLAAGPAGLLVPMTVGRGHAGRGRRALQDLLAELGRRHGCAGQLLD